MPNIQWPGGTQASENSNIDETLDKVKDAFIGSMNEGVSQIGRLFDQLNKQLQDQEKVVYKSASDAKKRCNIPERLWFEMEPELPYVVAHNDDGSLKKYYTTQGMHDYIAAHTVYPKLSRR